MEKKMRYLEGVDLYGARTLMEMTADIAKRALCLRAKCGSIIVSQGGQVIGIGYNAPPNDDVNQRRCNEEYDLPQKFKYDRTCCMHAEWRAILNALRLNATRIEGSTLYFTRVDDGGKILKSGPPYCTECSRAALDVGIKHFILWHEDGIAEYDTREYNDLSYQYIGP